MTHDLLTTGIVAAGPATIAVQLLKWLLARHVEPRWGRDRWNRALRILSGLVGLGYGAAVAGLEGAGAGALGGVCATWILAGLFRLTKTWSPMGPGYGPPADVPFDPGPGDEP